MKKKFIFMAMALLLIVALLCIGLPAMSPDVDVGAAAGAAVPAADLTALDSGALLIADNTAPVSAATAGEITIWLALSASLLTIAVVFRRKLDKLLNAVMTSLRRRNDSTLEGTGSSGVPRDCILPGVA